MFLTAVRHEVNNLESFVVVLELEIITDLLLKWYKTKGNQFENKKCENRMCCLT